MEWQLFAQLTLAIPVAVLGWLFAHYFASQRDLANERRKLITQYLIESYRKLESVCHRRKWEPANMADIESAIADIQLFGSPNQAKLAVKLGSDILKRFEEGMGIPFDEILNDLRNNLRSELRLEPVKDEVVFFRYEKSE